MGKHVGLLLASSCKTKDCDPKALNIERAISVGPITIQTVSQLMWKLYDHKGLDKNLKNLNL